MHRALIVARMRPDKAADIAQVFAESDRGPLPDLIGVSGRSLFQFGDVYMHLVESETPPRESVAKYAKHPEFQDISKKLLPFVSAYNPETWRVPEDAMAQEFYRWERSGAL